MVGRHEVGNLILVPENKTACHEEESTGEEMLGFSIEIDYAATVRLPSFIEKCLHVKSIIT